MTPPARPVAVLAAPLLLAAAGLVHPGALTSATAAHWVALHVVLLPVFPLVALGFVVPLRDVPRRGPAGAARALAELAAFGYACFYSALDTIAGIGAGTVWRHAPPGSDPEALVAPLFHVGDVLGRVGVGALLVAVPLTCLALAGAGVAPARLLPGALVLVVAGWSFLDSHIFRPRGVLTMLGLAVGFALLTWASTGVRRPSRD